MTTKTFNRIPTVLDPNLYSASYFAPHLYQPFVQNYIANTLGQIAESPGSTARGGASFLSPLATAGVSVVGGTSQAGFDFGALLRSIVNLAGPVLGLIQGVRKEGNDQGWWASGTAPDEKQRKLAHSSTPPAAASTPPSNAGNASIRQWRV